MADNEGKKIESGLTELELSCLKKLETVVTKLNQLKIPLDEVIAVNFKEILLTQFRRYIADINNGLYSENEKLLSDLERELDVILNTGNFNSYLVDVNEKTQQLHSSEAILSDVQKIIIDFVDKEYDQFIETIESKFKQRAENATKDPLSGHVEPVKIKITAKEFRFLIANYNNLKDPESKKVIAEIIAKYDRPDMAYSAIVEFSHALKSYLSEKVIKNINGDLIPNLLNNILHPITMAFYFQTRSLAQAS